MIQREKVSDYLIKRRKDAHKGDLGHLFVLAGSLGMTGAAYLTSKAAIRSGCGIVTLGIPEGLDFIMEIKLTEVIKKPLYQTPEMTLSLRAEDQILDFSKTVDALAIGPGLSQNAEVKNLIKEIIPELDRPAVIDADGLNAIASEPEILKKSKAPLIITPHPGEMARISRLGAAEIQNDRESVAADHARKLNVVVVLKGHKTVIANPEGDVYINKTGNPGMATAGMGDVLTGMIGSFLAQGIEPFKAAKLGAYLHGFAGDLAAKEKSQTSLIAEDVIDKLPLAFRMLRR